MDDRIRVHLIILSLFFFQGHFETFKVMVDHGVDPFAGEAGKTCLEMCKNDTIEGFLSTFKLEL